MHSLIRPANQSTGQSIDQSCQQALDEMINQSINHNAYFTRAYQLTFLLTSQWSQLHSPSTNQTGANDLYLRNELGAFGTLHKSLTKTSPTAQNPPARQLLEIKQSPPHTDSALPLQDEKNIRQPPTTAQDSEPGSTEFTFWKSPAAQYATFYNT